MRLDGNGLKRSLNRAALACWVVLALLVSLAAAAEQGDVVGAEAELAKPWSQRSPVFPTTPLTPYFDFKQKIRDQSGIGWTINYSIMDGHRVKNPFSGSNYSMTGQLDLIGTFDLDTESAIWGKGQLVVFYIYVHQIGGLTTTKFGELNGNITPINDSDPAHFLRQAYYRHDFLDGRLSIMGGKTEPLLTFGANRFALDDRENFMAPPMSSIPAKDRVASSPGGLLSFKPLPWLSIGASVNTLTPEDSQIPVPPELAKTHLYSFTNLTLDFEVPHLGRGIYRVNGVFTAAQEGNPATSGVILSFDQDLGTQWGAFIRYDDTEFQTLTSPIRQSVAFGFYNRSPFGRQADRFGIGAFRTKSSVDGEFEEWGGETFYRLAVTRWCDLSLALQVFGAAKSNDTFATLGGRIFFRL